MTLLCSFEGTRWIDSLSNWMGADKMVFGPFNW